MLAACAVHTARQFARGVIMPNLVPPVTKVAEAAAYRDRIRRAVPAELKFEPLMTCYLTDGADPAELARGKQEGVWVAAKLYPAHATTNSAHGVTSMDTIARGLEAMEKAGMPLLVHGEVTDPEVDIFDREAVFLDKVLTPLLKRHPGLKVVLEHITTREGVDFVEAHPGAAGRHDHAASSQLQPQCDLQGRHPSALLLPADRQARGASSRAATAATSGSAQFFLGTDTAPHTADTKECACGCAGIFNAPVAMQVYAQVFMEENALDRLEAFASLNGPRFYGLPANEERITLQAKPLDAPEHRGSGGPGRQQEHRWCSRPDTPVGWSF